MVKTPALLSLGRALDYTSLDYIPLTCLGEQSPKSFLESRSIMEVKTDTRLEAIRDKAQEMKNVEDEISELERKLKAKQQYHNQLSAVELPEMMAEIGLQKFTLTDGTNFSVKPVFEIKAPKFKMHEINQWLVKNGHDGMVKTLFKFPRGVPDSEINKIVQFIHSQGWYCETERVIHPQTLGKWGREMESEGMVIPEDLFSIFRSNKTVIER